MNTHSDVSDRPPAPPNNSPGLKANAFFREGLLQHVAPVLLRWALAVTFLSAVANRFGLWGPPGTANVSWGDWSHFVAYTAKVNSFLPGIVAPALAVMATAAEALLGVALLLGVFLRPVAWATATLLALFAGAMILSFGIKAPLNYSVFVDAAAALVLSVWPATPTFKSTRTRA
jgi:putative oxidoreductase